MKNNLTRFISFIVIGVVIGFSGTILFTGNDQEQAVDQKDTNKQEQQESEEPEATETVATVPTEAEPLQRNGCFQCHSVDALNVDGGKVGPDLSNIYAEIDDKRGMSLDEFLQEPSTAVMSSVIQGNPLNAEERSAIIESLQKASEK